MSTAVARRYTQGLFGYAQEHGVVEAVDNSLRLIADTLATSAEFRSLLEHPLIKPDAKAKIVTDVFGTAVDPLATRFIKLLFQRGRGDQLVAVSESFHALAEAAEGVISVTVETAFPLKDNELSDLEGQLSEVLHKTVRATVLVNKDLIAGFRVHVGNRVMDSTLLGALGQIEQRLADRSATA